MNYVISGKVIHGYGYGRKIGFPTVNLDVKFVDVRRLQKGVYVGIAELEGRTYRAGIVVGPGDRIEAHLIGYEGDAYGKEVTLVIDKFLREYKNFESEAELIKQIKEDLKLC